MISRTHQPLDPSTLDPGVDLVTAAELLGIGRTASYQLVRAGQFPVPVLRIGRLIRVPTAPLLQLLGLTNASNTSTFKTGPS